MMSMHIIIKLTMFVQKEEKKLGQMEDPKHKEHVRKRNNNDQVNIYTRDINIISFFSYYNFHEKILNYNTKDIVCICRN